MVFVAIGVVGLGIITTRTFRNTNARSDAAMTVAQTLDWMLVDIQPAKSVTLVNSTYIRIFYPTKNSDLTYNRSQTDTTNYVEYFRATTAGAASTTGTCIARKVGASGTARILCRNVTTVDFTTDLAGSITIDVTATGSFGATYQMINRAVYMRNS